MFMCGGRIAFFGGDIKLLVKDIQVVRPTLFISVPRLLNRIYDKVRGGEGRMMVLGGEGRGGAGEGLGGEGRGGEDDGSGRGGEGRGWEGEGLGGEKNGMGMYILQLQITGGVAQGSLLKKAIFNRAMKSKTKDLRRWVWSVAMVTDTSCLITGAWFTRTQSGTSWS